MNVSAFFFLTIQNEHSDHLSFLYVKNKKKYNLKNFKAKKHSPLGRFLF